MALDDKDRQEIEEIAKAAMAAAQESVPTTPIVPAEQTRDPLDTEPQNFMPPLRYDGHRLRPFFWWSTHVLPTVYENSLSYYEVLDKVMFKLIEALKDLNDLGGDVESLNKAFLELQNEYWHFKLALIKNVEDFKDNMNKAFQIFMEKIEQEREEFEKHMTEDWTKFRLDLTTTWNNFRDAMYIAWAEEEAKLEKWLKEADEWYQQAKKDWEQMKSDWQTFKTTMEEAWNTFKTTMEQEWSQMKTDWQTYQDTMNKAWEEYQQKLNKEWADFKQEIETRVTTVEEAIAALQADWEKWQAELNTIAPWLGPECLAQFAGELPADSVVLQTYPQPDKGMQIKIIGKGFDSPAIFVGGEANNINFTLNQLNTKLTSLEHITATKSGGSTLTIVPDNGYILCWNTSLPATIDAFEVYTPVELHNKTGDNIIPLYGQGSSKQFTGLWWTMYRYSILEHWLTQTEKDIKQAQNDITSNTESITSINAALNDKQDKTQAYNQLTIEWRFDSWHWDGAAETLTFHIPPRYPMLIKLDDTIGSMYYKNTTAQNSYYNIWLSHLFPSSNWSFQSYDNAKRTVTIHCDNPVNGLKYFEYQSRKFVEAGTPATSPAISSCYIAQAENNAASFFFWGFTNTDLTGINNELDSLDDELTELTTRVSTNEGNIDLASCRVVTDNSIVKTGLDEENHFFIEYNDEIDNIDNGNPSIAHIYDPSTGQSYHLLLDELRGLLTTDFSIMINAGTRLVFTGKNPSSTNNNYVYFDGTTFKRAKAQDNQTLPCTVLQIENTYSDYTSGTLFDEGFKGVGEPLPAWLDTVRVTSQPWSIKWEFDTITLNGQTVTLKGHKRHENVDAERLAIAHVYRSVLNPVTNKYTQVTFTIRVNDITNPLAWKVAGATNPPTATMPNNYDVQLEFSAENSKNVFRIYLLPESTDDSGNVSFDRTTTPRPFLYAQGTNNVYTPPAQPAIEIFWIDLASDDNEAYYYNPYQYNTTV